MNWLIVALLLVLCADIGTTWYLLVNYRKQVREGGAFGSVVFRGGFYGHLVWVAMRVCLAVLVIQLMGWMAMATWTAVTGYAIVHNLIVLRRLKHG